MTSRAEITTRYARAFKAADKRTKGRILDEVVSVTGWSRDNARRLLTSAAQSPPGAGRSVATRPRKQRAGKYSYDARGSRSHAEKPESYFCGTWDGRHPLNVPGPFYGAETDTCCDGPPLAPSSLLYDHDGQGFVWRQPRTEEETHELMTGASSDPFSGYAWDGDQHWTPDLVRSWWAERHAHTPLIDLIVARVAGPRPELRSDYEDLWFRCLSIGGYSEDERRLLAGIVHEFVEYRLSGMERDLRRYLHFLETGGYPDADATLPTL